MKNKKQSETAETLQIDQTRIIQIFSQLKLENSDSQLITFILRNFHQKDDQDEKENIHYLKEDLQEILESIDQKRIQAFDNHCVEDKMANFMNQFDHHQKVHHKTGFNLNSIEQLINQNSKILASIEKWRLEKNQIISKLLQKKKKINYLNLIKYNKKNYLEQLLLVNDVKIKIQQKKSILDHDSLEIMANKQLIPYNFYKQYCLNSCVEIIITKINRKQLVLMFKRASTIHVLKRLEQKLFYQNKKHFPLSQKCGLLLNLIDRVKFINKEKQVSQSTFILLFHPLFLEQISKNCDLSLTQFLKSRSIMQYCPQTVQIWQNFEQSKLQQAFLWYCKEINELKATSFIKKNNFNEKIQQYNDRFFWIKQTKINTINKKIIFKMKKFKTEYIKIAILKIIQKPLITIYHANKSQNPKQFRSHHQQYLKYLIYTLFKKFPNLHQFLNIQFSYFNEKEPSSPQRQLSLNEIYLYFNFLENSIQIQLQEPKLAEQFLNFWSQIIAEEFYLERNMKCNKQLKNWERQFIQKQFQRVQQIKQYEFELEKLLENKKRYKNQQQLQNIYTLLIKLHFNSKNYFLLNKAIGLDFLVEIQKLRIVAYKCFFN